MMINKLVFQIIKKEIKSKWLNNRKIKIKLFKIWIVKLNRKILRANMIYQLNKMKIMNINKMIN